MTSRTVIHTADMLVTTNSAAQRSKCLDSLTTLELAELDVEFGRRAISVKRPGFVSKTHAAVRIALAAR